MRGVAVAYFRGKVSAGLEQLQGGMMAVGSSPEEAKKLILDIKLTAGVVTVAYVNSPSSVTLSGDVAVLEELRAGVFARRLKVEVAYHSTYMNSAIGDYSLLIAHVEPAQSFKGQAVQVSSVMGVEVDAELLDPYYWVRNLTSPALFADAPCSSPTPSKKWSLLPMETERTVRWTG
jgi:zearalenone synthase (highly reducing iterative type I polyketide synthase)